MADIARSIETAWRGTSTTEIVLAAGALGLFWLAIRPKSAAAPASGEAGGLKLLTPVEEKWVDYIHRNVVPRLEGTRAEQARTAALVTWWSLKEGIFDVPSSQVPSPLRHNLCSAAGEKQIGDLAVCTSGAWQIGLSGIQGNVVSLAQVEEVAGRIYPGKNIEDVLADTADDAGVDSATKDQIVASTGALRKAWLLRDPAISFTIQAPFVEQGCLRGAGQSWCFGAWDTARAFASDRQRIDEVVGQLEARFRTGAGLSRGTKIALAAGAAGIGYALYRASARFGKT